MAEVLSQSQIDALLNAARSGEMNLDGPGSLTFIPIRQELFV